MKYLFIILIFFLSGCAITDSMVKTVQPKGNKVYPPEPKLFHIQAQEIILRAPVRTITDKQGNTIIEPIMTTTVQVLKDGSTITTTEPVMAEFWTKDQLQKQPTTVLDVISKGMNLFLIGYGINQAFGAINGMANNIAKDPVIIKQDAPRTDYVTSNPDGTINVNRG
jgi:hypothetical protein